LELAGRWDRPNFGEGPRYFRGAGERGSGTAFEIGFAAALGKPVRAYRDDLSALRERVRCGPTADVCDRGYLVKDFGLA
jgi:nucleoside deoxyribosyltransferase